MHFRTSATAMLAAISVATLAAIPLLAAPAYAEDGSAARATIRLAQADDAPMVITPHPQPGQLRPPANDPGGPGVPYQPAPDASALPPPPGSGPYVPPEAQSQGTFSVAEIKETGHRFFGTVSMGMAEAIEYTFQRAGRPNGYILGEEAGGAFIAGVRYGEGTLYTKDAGDYRIYWQGPSLGYDFGAEGSKTMVLVYDLRSPGEIYSTFVGVDGSAYLIGGVGVTFMARGHVILAPLRSGLGLRLGANVGYLKYTREPTWNPF
jgi:hypothetical protein